MTIIAQAAPLLWGGVLGGSINSLVGFSLSASQVASSMFAEGFVFGAMGTMASKIIVTRTEQIGKHYEIEEPLAIVAIHVTAFALMTLSINGARYVANNYLNFQIPTRTIAVLNGLSICVGLPLVGAWTIESLGW